VSTSSSTARLRGAHARLRGARIENLTSKGIQDVSLDVFAIGALEEDIAAEIDDEYPAQGVTGAFDGRHGVESSTRASVNEATRWRDGDEKTTEGVRRPSTNGRVALLS